jgi:cell division protein FtsB
MLRWIGLILVILLIALQLKLWVGNGSMHEVERLRATVKTQTEENAGLLKRNQALSADVEDLKHGEQATEARARSELGLIKQGETFYQVVEPAASATAAPAPASTTDGGN